MRPRSHIQSVVLYNRPNSVGDWIPTKIEVNSWVALQPGKKGGHAQDAKKHGLNTVAGAYKAKVLKF
jgi:hypothetical protein